MRGVQGLFICSLSQLAFRWLFPKDLTFNLLRKTNSLLNVNVHLIKCRTAKQQTLFLVAISCIYQQCDSKYFNNTGVCICLHSVTTYCASKTTGLGTSPFIHLYSARQIALLCEPEQYEGLSNNLLFATFSRSSILWKWISCVIVSLFWAWCCWPHYCSTFCCHPFARAAWSHPWKLKKWG